MAPRPTDLPPRRVEYRTLASLTPAQRNPKAHDLRGIRQSIRTLGIADVVCVLDGRTDRLIAGHGRVEALTEMEHDGETVPEGVVVDADGLWSVPVLVGWSSRSDLEADTAIIGLNQHTIAGGWDRDLLDDMLRELRADAVEPITVGFTAWPKHLDYADDEGDPTSRLGEPVYKIVVECRSELHQRELLDRLTAEGLSVQALFV